MEKLGRGSPGQRSESFRKSGQEEAGLGSLKEAQGLLWDTEASKSGRWQQGARERPAVGSDGGTAGRRPWRHLSHGLLATKEQLGSEEEGAMAPQRTSSQERWGKRAEGEPKSCLGFLGMTVPGPHNRRED